MGTKWFGWFRADSSSQWELVAEGRTLDQCSKHLLAATRHRSTPASCRLMTGGRHPEEVFRRYEQPEVAG